MTEPTQAQIEAAAKAMAEMEAGWVKAEHFEGLAEAALTAAAQVGEQDDKFNVLKRSGTPSMEVKATIECCAQVIEEIAAVADEAQAEALRVAVRHIRKLKDDP